jgi:hypothetical protein
MLGLKMDNRQWEVIKPFLEFLNLVRKNQLTDIKSDKKIEERLKRI